MAVKHGALRIRWKTEHEIESEARKGEDVGGGDSAES